MSEMKERYYPYVYATFDVEVWDAIKTIEAAIDDLSAEQQQHVRVNLLRRKFLCEPAIENNRLPEEVKTMIASRYWNSGFCRLSFCDVEQLLVQSSLRGHRR